MIFALCYLFKTQTTFAYIQTSVLVYLSIIGTALEKFNDIVCLLFIFQRLCTVGMIVSYLLFLNERELVVWHGWF